MSGVIREFEGLRVKVDEVVFMPGLDAPPEKPLPFVYFISIHNDSSVPVVVEGDGIVGQTPVLEPGGHFSYNSYHVVAGRARVTGAFFGETALGEWIFTRIPEFVLEVAE